MNGQQIIYPLKQKDICDYNPRCLMSSGLMLDDIKMNLCRNKAVRQYVEVVDGYLKKTENKKIYLYGRSLQYFYRKKDNNESIDF